MSDKSEVKIYTLREARKIDYTVQPIECPYCEHVGEVEYNQGTDRFYCSWCGRDFRGKK